MISDRRGGDGKKRFGLSGQGGYEGRNLREGLKKI